MQDYQREFLDFAIDVGVLRFGEFTLKSGRVSPYFFNSGLFNTGSSLARLGRYYAQAVVERWPSPSPTTTTATCPMPSTARRPRTTARAASSSARRSRAALIIDDVISAGTSVRESVDIIQASDAIPAGVVIALDRQERGKGETSAIQEVERDYRLKVASIVQLGNLVEYLGKSV